MKKAKFECLINGQKIKYDAMASNKNTYRDNIFMCIGKTNTIYINDVENILDIEKYFFIYTKKARHQR